VRQLDIGALELAVDLGVLGDRGIERFDRAARVGQDGLHRAIDVLVANALDRHLAGPFLVEAPDQPLHAPRVLHGRDIAAQLIQLAGQILDQRLQIASILLATADRPIKLAELGQVGLPALLNVSQALDSRRIFRDTSIDLLL
jgi:hypothetical protein